MWSKPRCKNFVQIVVNSTFWWDHCRLKIPAFFREYFKGPKSIVVWIFLLCWAKTSRKSLSREAKSLGEAPPPPPKLKLELNVDCSSRKPVWQTQSKMVQMLLRSSTKARPDMFWSQMQTQRAKRSSAVVRSRSQWVKNGSKTWSQNRILSTWLNTCAEELAVSI